MKKAIYAVWHYFQSMNSEPGGGISIKRNVSWVLVVLFVFVQAFALVILRNIKPDSYIKLVEFLSVLDACMILLVLSITSIEKLSELFQKIKGGLLGGNNAPVAAPATDPENKEEVKNA